MIKRYVTAVFMVAAMWFLGMALGWAVEHSSIQVNSDLLHEGAKVICALIVIALLVRYKKCITAFHIRTFLKSVFVYGLPVLLYCGGIVIHSLHWMYTKGFSVFVKEFDQYVLYYLVFFIAVGFTEEVICRAGIMNYLEGPDKNMTKRRIVLMCIFSAILFGILHFSSWNSRLEIKNEILQVIFAALFGFSMSVIYLKTKNLFSTMILHYIWNVAVTINGLEYYYAEKMGRRTEMALHERLTYIYFIPVIIMVIGGAIILFRSSTEELILNKPLEKIIQKEGENE